MKFKGLSNRKQPAAAGQQQQQPSTGIRRAPSSNLIGPYQNRSPELLTKSQEPPSARRASVMPTSLNASPILPSLFKKKSSYTNQTQSHNGVGLGNVNQAKDQSVFEKNRMTYLRDMSMKKDNWNIFVGEARYKTNFFLKFLDNSTKRLYEKQNLEGSVYSLRLMMLAVFSIMIVYFCRQPCPNAAAIINFQKDTGEVVTTPTNQSKNDSSFCLTQAIFVTLVAIVSFFGTLNKQRFIDQLNNIRYRKLLIILLPMLWSFKLVNQGVIPGQQNIYYQHMSAAMFFFPILIISPLVLSDWIEFLAVCLAQLFLGVFLTSNAAGLAFNYPTLQVLALYVLFFACQEKVRKEQFIIGHTNAKTKKILLGLINQVPSPIAIVSGAKSGSMAQSQPGQIVFCNAQFEKMLSERLGMTSVPQNIFRLTKDDEESTQKLKQICQMQQNPKSSSTSPLLPGRQGSMKNLMKTSQQSQLNPEVPNKIEIKLTKAHKILDSNRKRDYSPVPQSIKEETKSNASNTNSHQKIQTLKDIFDSYEIAVIKADSVVYQHAHKSLMLTFNLVSENKARNQLLYTNTQNLYKQIQSFNRRLQQLYNSAERGENMPFANNQQSIIEFLGTTYLVMNKIQQIAHEFQDETLQLYQADQKCKVSPVQQGEETFLLKEEILQCIESLSAKCLSQTASIKLDTKFLPERLAGDLQKFRLSLHCVSEFAMNYCKEGIIDINVTFSGMSQNGQYMISFDFTFNRNRQFNEEPLMKLLNSLQTCSGAPGSTWKLKTEEILLQNYEEFFGLIQNFGMGMIIFPSLMHELKGSYSIQRIGGGDALDGSQQDAKSDNNSAASPNILGVGLNNRPMTQEFGKGDQDQAPALLMGPESPNLNAGSLKINFKIPFNHAEMTKKVFNPYFPFNPNKEVSDDRQYFKSPMLKTRERETRDTLRNEMKRIMEEAKMPMFHNQKRNLAGGGGVHSLGPSNFAQLVHNEQQLKLQQQQQNEATIGSQSLANISGGQLNMDSANNRGQTNANSYREVPPHGLIESSTNMIVPKIQTTVSKPIESSCMSASPIEGISSDVKDVDQNNKNLQSKQSNTLVRSNEGAASDSGNLLQVPQLKKDQLNSSRRENNIGSNSISDYNGSQSIDMNMRSGGPIDEHKKHIQKLMTQAGNSIGRNKVKQVEKTLRDFELKSGGMNNQNFFKNKKLSQGGLTSLGSPMDSDEKNDSMKKKPHHDIHSDAAPSVNSQPQSLSPGQKRKKSGSGFGRNLFSDINKESNDSAKATGSLEINANSSSGISGFNQTTTQTFPNRVNSAGLTENSKQFSGQDFTSEQTVAKSQSGYIGEQSSGGEGKAEPKSVKRGHSKRLGQDNSVTRRTSLFQKHQNTKISEKRDQRPRGQTFKTKNTIEDRQNYKESGDEMKLIEDSFVTSSSFDSETDPEEEKKSFEGEIPSNLKHKKSLRPSQHAGSGNNYHSRHHHSGQSQQAPKTQLALAASPHEINDDSFAMKNFVGPSGAVAGGGGPGSCGTPSLKKEIPSYLQQNPADQMSSGQLREVLSFGDIQSRLPSDKFNSRERTYEERKSANHHSGGEGSSFYPNKGENINQVRTSDPFTLNNANNNSSHIMLMTGSHKQNITQLFGENSRIQYQASSSSKSHTSFMSEEIEGSNEADHQMVDAELDDEELEDQIVFQDHVQDNLTYNNQRMQTQPLSKHMIHQWAFDTLSQSTSQGATKNLWQMQTQRYSALEQRQPFHDPQAMLQLPTGRQTVIRPHANSQHSFNMRALGNAVDNPNNPAHLLNQFGWAPGTSDIGVTDSTGRVFGPGSRGESEQEQVINTSGILGGALGGGGESGYNTQRNQVPMVRNSRGGPQGGMALEEEKEWFSQKEQQQNLNILANEPVVRIHMKRSSTISDEKQASFMKNRNQVNLRPEFSTPVTVSQIVDSNPHSHRGGFGSTVQTMQQKQQNEMFPYRRSEKSMQYQEQLRQMDQQQGDDLVFWDRKLQDALAHRLQERIDSMGTYGSQMKLMPGGMPSTFAHIMMLGNGASIDTSKRYVLVVEDNNMISEILVETLKTFNLEAIVAENGKVAVEKFTQFMREGVLFELILMDIIMPEMGGYESTQLIRKVEREYNLSGQEKHFICGFSANVNPDIVKKCHDCGMNNIMSKPMTPATLKQLLDENRRISNIIGDECMSSKNMLLDHAMNGNSAKNSSLRSGQNSQDNSLDMKQGIQRFSSKKVMNKVAQHFIKDNNH